MRKGDQTRIILDNERLRITHYAGSDGDAVVSFAGVGLKMDGIPQEEFVRSLAFTKKDHFFVIDKRRTWYNDTADEITVEMTDRLTTYRKVFTLGNSMGGFGAVYFGSLFPNCERAIAFSPQFSVNPAIVPWECRWQEFRSAITKWCIPDALSSITPKLRSFLFFGTALPDCLHADHFVSTPGHCASVFFLKGQDHRVAKFLRERECLALVLGAIFEGREASLPAILAHANIEFDLQFCER
jgi:hypothetical protein